MPMTTRAPAALIALAFALTCVAPDAARAQAASAPGTIAEIRSPNAPRREAEETNIRAVWLAGREAWNRGDSQALAALFADNADLVAGGGTHTRGREAIGRFFADLMITLGAGTRYTIRIDSVRFITPEIAIVHGFGGFLRPGEAELSADRRGVQSLVAIKDGGAWRITSMQVTRIQPAR